MAEVVKDFAFRGVGRTIGGFKYPWSEWLDGRIWKITIDVDFSCPVESMRSLVALTAKRMGLRLRTNREGETLFIQAYKE